VINHVDKSILAINRRHAKKFSSAFEQPPSGAQSGGLPHGSDGRREADLETEKERGYENFKEVARDVESLVDVLWVSGTRAFISLFFFFFFFFVIVYLTQLREHTDQCIASLQIPYLISLSVLVNTYLPDYPFVAKPTFRLLRKLDSFFASLILGEDSESGQPLSGFEGRNNIVSMTEKVRVKSIAETARVIVVEAGEGRDPEVDDEMNGESDEDDMDIEGFGLGEAPSKWEMETARVYEKTIQLLGDELGKAGEFCDENMARGEEGDEGNDVVMSP
jgi:hypothetical protein